MVCEVVGLECIIYMDAADMERLLNVLFCMRSLGATATSIADATMIEIAM